MSEELDIYEWQGNDLMHIGVMDKREAELKGIWHKISRVYPIKKINGEYYVILQRRSKHKKIGALNFSIAVSEHVKAGESDVDACIRGITEEFGINVEKDKLEKAYNIKFMFDKGDIKERTYCTTYVLEFDNDLKDLTLEKSEVEGAYIASIKDLNDMFEKRIDNVEVRGLSLNEDETEYINDITTININSFVDFNFYKEDFSKLKLYIDKIHIYDKDRQMQCWENVADDVRFYQEIDEELFKKYISKDDKVLDFGCGYGRTLSKLKEIGYKNLEGIDFSKKMIERAERETKDIKYIVWDSESKLNKNCYDVIILIFVFASVYTDEEQDKILVELKSALKPDGIIFMCDALLGEDERNIARYKEFFDKYGVYGTFETDNGMIARHLDYTRLEEIKNRFENINYKEQVIKTQNGNSVRSFTFIGRNKK